MRLKSLENTLCLAAASTDRAKRATKRASTDAVDVAAAIRLAYPKPCSVRARAVDAAARVASANACNALRAVEELEELVTALTGQVASLKGSAI